jgi:hypothetical protein
VALTELEQVIYFQARERRKSLAGFPDMFRNMRIFGNTVMEVANIDTTAIFPSLSTPISFKTAIRILAGTGAGLDEHRGLIFEFGDATIGTALWVGDSTIGFHAGEDGVVNGATALFDNITELPEGLELEIIASVRPGDGRVRVWGNGTELSRSTASSDTFGAAGTWTAASAGSFASVAQGTIIPDVPVISQGAPSGFEVIEPLSVFVGKVPRFFV